MSKPNYEQMSQTELKNYLKLNRQDEEAWSIFFQKIEENNQGQWYPPPQTMPNEEFEAIIQEKLGK